MEVNSPKSLQSKFTEYIDQGVSLMKALILSLILTSLVLGYGGFLIGYIPVEFEFGKGYALLFGGYGSSEGGIMIGGMGFGGDGELITEDGTKLGYEYGAGGAVVEKPFEIGPVKIYIGGFGGFGSEKLMVRVDGGKTLEDFKNGKVEGYLRIKRWFVSLMPLVRLGLKIGKFAEVYIGAGYSVSFSPGGWKTELGSGLGIGNFYKSPVFFAGVNF